MEMDQIKVTLVGATGRMGSAVLTSVAKIPKMSVIARINHQSSTPYREQLISECDVVIDFSSPATTAWIAEMCAGYKKPLVTGTTGRTDEQKAVLVDLSSIVPVVAATNFSTGVNVLFWLTRKTAEILGPDFDLEVVEMHHRLKKDAPSGTATKFAEILADVRGLQIKEALRHGRSGIVGERTKGEIGVHSIRGGDVVGDHTVIFAGMGERVELTHKASSREAFANGALFAARWIIGRKPGLYTMEDVLGLAT